MLKAIILFITCLMNFSAFAQDLIITNEQNLVMPDINQITDRVLETEKVYDNLSSIEFQTNLSTGEYAIRLPDNTDSLRLFGID